ncbi:Fatty acid hydroxylase vlmA [Penicillium chermesinum]|uniref:Fatty acid hydroxylase vlmA n=1 Tax=Penicillium chermesinum TaxID=63820 RepID=A0A9W9NPB5_9EURO|nr:Fatty acid hydroxylase vlmA [Penicillium chermesinum]KAJ5223647.1 Fatty acid hydroxylase vlmA [Penicillium chermesinum]KAJ6155527.1 Fatty acid hydroxylase vlmA [Penicillium chermesinum]
MADRNPKDSMKSTWRTQARSEWTLFHWFFEVLNIHPEKLDTEVPVFQKEDPIPYVPDWSMHRWVLSHAIIPILLHHAYVLWTGHNLSPIAAFFLYSLSFNAIGIHELHVLRRLGHIHGFLDGDKHPRDGVPDVGVAKVVRSLVSTATARPMFSVMLAYRTSQPPSSINLPWLVLEMGLYGIILDFWFYWYHRLMHDVTFLWKYHRTHHLTKHPNPLLTLYADLEQEFFDIAGIPLMTYFSMKAMGMPMGFYEWWICHQYVVYAELAGHSGLRVHASPPNVFTFVLRWFNAELVIEDHDMHHRKGWKSSYNYGKQTRLWDRIFGTCCDRVESVPQNIDYENTSVMHFY